MSLAEKMLENCGDDITIGEDFVQSKEDILNFSNYDKIHRYLFSLLDWFYNL